MPAQHPGIGFHKNKILNDLNNSFFEEDYPMKTMKIYEPAMCCPTGLCGVGVDPELLRISTVLNTLKQNGVEVQGLTCPAPRLSLSKARL